MKLPTALKRALRIVAYAGLVLACPVYAANADDEAENCGFFDAEYTSTSLADESPQYGLKLRFEEEFPFDPGELGFVPEEVFLDAYVYSIVISAVDKGSAAALSDLYLPVLCAGNGLPECSALLLLTDDDPETDDLAPFVIKWLDLNGDFAVFRRGISNAPFLVLLTNLYPELYRMVWIDQAVGVTFHSTPHVTPDFTSHSVWKFERCNK